MVPGRMHTADDPDVRPEGDPRQAVGEVLEVEREERDEARDHQDAPAVALDGGVDPREPGARRPPSLDRVASEMPGDQESERGREGRRDPRVHGAPDRAEHEAAEEGQGKRGDEEELRHHVAGHVQDGRPGPVRLDRRPEPGSRSGRTRS